MMGDEGTKVLQNLETSGEKQVGQKGCAALEETLRSSILEVALAEDAMGLEAGNLGARRAQNPISSCGNSCSNPISAQ